MLRPMRGDGDWLVAVLGALGVAFFMGRFARRLVAMGAPGQAAVAGAVSAAAAAFMVLLCYARWRIEVRERDYERAITETATREKVG